MAIDVEVTPPPSQSVTVTLANPTVTTVSEQTPVSSSVVVQPSVVEVEEVGSYPVNVNQEHVYVERVAEIDLNGHRVVTVDDNNELIFADSMTLAHAYRPVWLTLDFWAAGSNATVVAYGDVVEPSWNWVPGPIYLDSNGFLTQTIPDTGTAVYARQVGYADSSTSITFQPRDPIVL